MNSKYKFWALLGLSLTLAFSAHARQEEKKQELQSTTQRIAELSANIATEIAGEIQKIDFSELTIEVQKLAKISEKAANKLALKVEQMDFSEVENQLRGLESELSTLNFDIHWDEGAFVGSAPFQEEKIIEKTYSVGANDKLNIDNRYGKIKVSNWNKNEFKIVVRITSGESSEKRAKEAINRVTIQESKSGNQVSFKTSIATAESGWFSNLVNTGNTNSQLRIDYDVFVPIGNELTLSNSYGAIETGDRNGRFTATVKYGSLKAGELRSKNNAIEASYSKADISYLNEGTVSVKYGGLNIGEAEKVTLSLSYTGNGKVGIVNNSASVSLRYSGDFKLGLGSGIQKADVDAAYSSLSVTPSQGTSFNFNTDVSYGNFNYDRARTTIKHESKGNTSASYAGFWNKSSNNSVNISSKYGSVTMK